MRAESLQSCPALQFQGLQATKRLCPWDSPGKILNILTKVSCHAFFQDIFPTQGSNLLLLHLLHWQPGSLPLAPLGSYHMIQQFQSQVYTKRNENIRQYKNLYMNPHGSMFIIAKKWRKSKYPSSLEWINQLWCSCTTENYSVIKSNRASSSM